LSPPGKPMSRIDAGADGCVAEVAVPGDEDRLAGAERERACEVHRLVATQCALVRELAGALRERFVDADDHQLGVERVEHGRRKATGDQVAAECLPVLVLAHTEHHRRVRPAGGAEVNTA
jgi:hypothetical protein